MSTTVQPTGQRHDREDADMQDGLANGGLQPVANSTQTPDQANNVAIEVAAIAADDDAMDTTSDNPQGVILPGSAAEPREAAITPSSPDDANQVATSGDENPAPPADSVSWAAPALFFDVSPSFVSRLRSVTVSSQQVT